MLEIPATQLAYLIRSKQVTCTEVISAYIDRVKEVNPYLNAVVEDRFEAALLEAKQLDEKILKGYWTEEEMEKNKPLLGVPLTVKESIAVKGMSNQGGRVYKEKRIAKEDADVVACMRRAGAIILLVSNTPELCLNWETYNKITGVTRNPHNQKLTPGGSSGGEAALISSGASLIGLTSDIAGSSRLPAMFTGIFGHKPTPFSVSPYGHNPESDSPVWGHYFTTAPMCRYASDLPLVLDCMKNKEGPKIEPLKSVPISDIKFYYMENDGPSGTLCPIDPDIEKALLDVAKIFKAKKVNIELLKYALDMSMSSMLRIENIETIFNKPEAGESPPTVTKELLKFYLGMSNSVFTSVAIGLLFNLNRTLIPKFRHQQIDKMIQKLQKEFKDILGPDGVFIYPTFPKSAHQHFEIYHKLPDTAYMMIFNAIGFPATNCIVGRDRHNLPIGVQIVTLPGNDHLALQVAKEIEKLYGGWVKPPMENVIEKL